MENRRKKDREFPKFGESWVKRRVDCVYDIHVKNKHSKS